MIAGTAVNSAGGDERSEGFERQRPMGSLVGRREIRCNERRGNFKRTRVHYTEYPCQNYFLMF